MKGIFAKLFLVFVFICVNVFSLFAQSENQDFLRSMGKIYVVVAVIVAIFLGIVIFLITLERKISKLEKQIKDNE